MHPEDPVCGLYRYDPDGSLHKMESGLTISNGLGWSPDERTFYLTDTPQQRIYAYDFEPQSGSISNRRVFIDLSNEPFFPDGMTIDRDGCIWSAMWDGWCVIQFDPDGKEMQRIPMPVQCPTSCTFGGSELNMLYITSASVGLSQEAIEKELPCRRSVLCTHLLTHGFVDPRNRSAYPPVPLDTTFNRCSRRL